MIDTRIAGIPCVVEVLYYQPADPGWTLGPPEKCWPPSPAVIEYRVCDRRGRPAPWLERKMTEKDRERIEAEIEDAIKRQRQDVDSDAIYS